MEELVGFCSIPPPGGRFKGGCQQHRAFPVSLDRRSVQATTELKGSSNSLIKVGKVGRYKVVRELRLGRAQRHVLCSPLFVRRITSLCHNAIVISRAVTSRDVINGTYVYY